MRQQTVLQVDCGQRRGQVAKVARRGADEAAKLAEGPVGRSHGLVTAGHDQGQACGAVAIGFDPQVTRLDGAGRGALGAGAEASYSAPSDR